MWSISHACAVAHDDGIAAVGSGEGPAIGAIDALLYQRIEPQHALPAALVIAINRDKHSGNPVTLEYLRGAGTAEQAHGVS